MTDPYLFYAVVDCPDLGVRRGDLLVVRPGQEPPVVLSRSLPPNYGALLGALDANRLTPAAGCPPVDLLRQAVGDDATPPRPVARSRRGHLALLPD